MGSFVVCKRDCPTAVEKLPRAELLRIALMFAVGAIGAYFYAAYTDIISATASSNSWQPSLTVASTWEYTAV